MTFQELYECAKRALRPRVLSPFAEAGGVAAAVEELIRKEHPECQIKTQRADGLRECRKLLMLAKAGKLDGYLLEGMACPGGCVAGAGTVVSADTAAHGPGHRQRRRRQPLPRLSRPIELKSIAPAQTVLRRGIFLCKLVRAPSSGG